MKLLITDVYELTTERRRALEALGLELLPCADEAPYTGDPAQVEAAACKFFFQHNDIARFSSLRYIQINMAGFDHMPMEYIAGHGIEFHNARDVYSVPIAEFGIGGVLALYKRFRTFDRRQTAREWAPERHLLELTDKRVLILGAGSIGTAFAQRFRAFGCRVTGLSRTAGAREHFDEVLPMQSLDACLPAADIIVLSLPASGETRHILNEERLARVKPGAVLVNIARGALADEAALTRALAGGRLGGAVLDVFETEPLPADSPLWGMENVLVAPHTSFGAEYNDRRNFEVLLRNLRACPLLAS